MVAWPHIVLVNISLEDLRKHRELLALQLALLDRYLAELEAEGLPPTAPKTGVPVTAELGSLSSPLASTTARSLPITPVASVKPIAPPVTPAMAQAGMVPPLEAAGAASPEEVFLGSPSSGLSDREKYGCIALVVVVCLVFLGFLFGPYLWEILSQHFFSSIKSNP